MRPLSERAKEIFLFILENCDSAQMEPVVNDKCGDDDDLKQRVLKLLSANEGNDSLLDQQPATMPLVISESAGDVIGCYKLLQQIGEGGFGVVFMAEQTEPVRRRVALKVIKPGMDTKEVVARFEAERQALAIMEHPNIAKVFSAGATDSGRPYFVMELVKGVPITEYADANNLPAEGRLRLFSKVCRAVHHAHQKGVIHRDLKPSNVLVTLHDGEPVPKIIDFGVSKAICQPLTEKTMFTRFGQAIGTPQYMSPEQAEMSGLDIDTRIRTAKCLRYLGEATGSTDDLRHAIEMLDDLEDRFASMSARTALGKLYLINGDLHSAEETLQQACRDFADLNPQVELLEIPHLLLSRVYQGRKLKSKEDTYFSRAMKTAVEHHGVDVFHWSKRAMQYYDEGRYWESEFASLVSLNLGNQYVKYHLALAFFENGQRERAIDYMTQNYEYFANKGEAEKANLRARDLASFYDQQGKDADSAFWSARGVEWAIRMNNGDDNLAISQLLLLAESSPEAKQIVVQFADELIDLPAGVAAGTGNRSFSGCPE